MLSTLGLARSKRASRLSQKTMTAGDVQRFVCYTYAAKFPRNYGDTDGLQRVSHPFKLSDSTYEVDNHDVAIPSSRKFAAPCQPNAHRG